jgi:DNA-binding protein YbaB
LVSQHAADRLGRYTEMKNEIAAIKAEVSSADRTVTVVAGPGGSVLDLRLSEQAFSSGSPRSLSANIMSTLRLAVAQAAKQQASIVQQYVGDRLNIADRVMATQQEILGDKIEAGDQEQQKLAEQARQQAAGSVFEQQPRHRTPVPPAPQRYGPAQAQQPPAAAPMPTPQQRPPARRPDPRPSDDDGFQGLGGSDNW